MGAKTDETHDNDGRPSAPAANPYAGVPQPSGESNAASGGKGKEAAPLPPSESGERASAPPPQAAYGQPPAVYGAPQVAYPVQGQPAYGQPPPQAHPYGQPPPQAAYGQPPAPQAAYGQPPAPQAAYGQPPAPQAAYGQPQGAPVPGPSYGAAPVAKGDGSYPVAMPVGQANVVPQGHYPAVQAVTLSENTVDGGYLVHGTRPDPGLPTQFRKRLPPCGACGVHNGVVGARPGLMFKCWSCGATCRLPDNWAPPQRSSFGCTVL